MRPSPSPQHRWLTCCSFSVRNIVLRPCGSPEPTENNNLSEWGLPPPADPSFHVPHALLFSMGNATSLTLIDTPGPRCVLPLGSLVEVVLKRCRFRRGDLGCLLKHCKSLRKFVYTGTGEAQRTPPSPREVVDALEPSHRNLETLGIDFVKIRESDGLARISSLKQFTALKTLYIDVNALWDSGLADDTESLPYPDKLFTSLLPESIEDLALFCIDAYAESLGLRFEDHLKRLAWDRRRAGVFARLKTLLGKALSPLEHAVDDELENLPRIAALDEAKTLLSEDGVEVIFSEQGCPGPDFEDLISLC